MNDVETIENMLHQKFPQFPLPHRRFVEAWLKDRQLFRVERAIDKLSKTDKPFSDEAHLSKVITTYLRNGDLTPEQRQDVYSVRLFWEETFPGIEFPGESFTHGWIVRHQLSTVLAAVEEAKKHSDEGVRIADYGRYISTMLKNVTYAESAQ